jgi:hypothetical protein
VRPREAPSACIVASQLRVDASKFGHDVVPPARMVAALKCSDQVSNLKVQGLGFRSLGFRVEKEHSDQVSNLKVQGLGFRSLGFRVEKEHSDQVSNV